MKLQFSADLDHQQAALEAVLGVFAGQTKQEAAARAAVPAVNAHGQVDMLASAEEELGVANHLHLSDGQLLANVQRVQLMNGLAQSSSLDSWDFTLEMETGTGKTYVYLRSLFELNRRYGMTKFIVVVPSLAIKEGVYKTLQITEEHFRGLYDNCRYDYFVYDSAKREQVRSFARSDYIQIMVINIDAFRKSFTDPDKESKANLIHRADDRLSGRKPIEFIRASRPVVIIDEPQSVDTTAKSKEAIASLNPLCTFRYSATHLDKHHQLYRLDAIDAYERQLVKQIEVASIQLPEAREQPYLRLLGVDNSRSPVTAQIELDVEHASGLRRVTKKVRAGDDLQALSNGRALYSGFVINNIHCAAGRAAIDFTGRPEVIRVGEEIGGVDPDALKRLQIRKTIEEHLDKELRLLPQGIKVLSLFFIDRVANYRGYDAEGRMRKGRYAEWFEAEYRQLIGLAKYRALFDLLDLDVDPACVHDGYFAADKRKKGDPDGLVRLKDSTGKTADDESAYHLIMKDKERLLSFESRLRFIFSHSALREGWDNPNVFQICTLNETASTLKKRQEIGRGLRLAVNQSGERVAGFEVNTLTVMANESYDTFVRQLQREIEAEEGIRFGLLEPHQFANIVLDHQGDTPRYLGAAESQRLWQHLVDQGYLNARGKVQEKLRLHLQDNCLELPEAVKGDTPAIIALLKKIAGGLQVRNREARTEVSINRNVLQSDRFQRAWARIKRRTTYRVDFAQNLLVARCAAEIERRLKVPAVRFSYEKASVNADRGGLSAQGKRTWKQQLEACHQQLPDLIAILQQRTGLTRRSIVAILQQSNRLEDFKRNPQPFIDQVSTILKQQTSRLMVEGIQYHLLDPSHDYAQAQFEGQALSAYRSRHLLASQKSLYSHIVCASDAEARLAWQLESNDAVTLYAKLPAWFRIDTPLGGYRPHWLVLVEQDTGEQLYLVDGVAPGIRQGSLPQSAEAMFACAKAHFAALGMEEVLIQAEEIAS